MPHNKTKKVFIVTLDITLVGGIERVVCNKANSLCNDYQVIIVSMFKKNKNIFYPINDAIEIVYLNENNFFNLNGFFKKIISHYKIVKSVIVFLNALPKKETIVIISTLTNISIYLGVFSHSRKIYKIAAEHSQYNAHNILVKGARILSYYFIDKIVTLTKNDKLLFENFFSVNKVVCIPNSVSFYSSSVANLSNNTIVTVGRLVDDKGFDILVRVFSKVAKKYPHWKLNIIGSGILLNSLQKQIETFGCLNQIQIKPFTKNIEDELLEGSFYVCSSRTEAFPMAMLEAMSCGLPILSFDCPVGPREIIENEIDGTLVEHLNEEKLQLGIEEYIESYEKRCFYSKASKRKIKMFAPEVIFPMWKELINNA